MLMFSPLRPRSRRQSTPFGSAELTPVLRQFCQRKTAGPAEAFPATQSPASRANPPHSRSKVKKQPVLGSGFERTECFDAGRPFGVHCTNIASHFCLCGFAALSKMDSVASDEYKWLLTNLSYGEESATYASLRM